MNDQDIYTKTEAGREEMRTRALHLAGALRTVLLLVDGHRTVAQLKELMTGGKAPADALDQLLAMGLIAISQAAPVAAAPPPPAPASAPQASSPSAPQAAPAPAPARAAPPPSPAPAPAPAPDDSLTALSLGSASAQRFNRLYSLMNEIVSDYLGLRGYFMQLKIEKCASAEELLALRDELGAAIAKGHGKDVAAELMTRIESAA